MVLSLSLLLPGQSFHDRLKAESDILETYDVEESVKYITVREDMRNRRAAVVSGCCDRLAGGRACVRACVGRDRQTDRHSDTAARHATNVDCGLKASIWSWTCVCCCCAGADVAWQ